ncbi:MAG: hypothetical protein F6K09_37975 [Merismopedia sp. SIO2A8]|nr:hypothetical protein [Merismopedia sp. SIO2A8]
MEHYPKLPQTVRRLLRILHSAKAAPLCCAVGRLQILDIITDWSVMMSSENTPFDLFLDK